MRIVIDSNVWISALLFGGNPRKVFQAVVQNCHIIVVSDELIAETRRVVAQKFPDFVDDLEALLVALAPRINYARIGHLDIQVCRDPDDDKIIATAVAGQASSLVSGDKDLLVLKKYQKVNMVTPAQAVQKL